MRVERKTIIQMLFVLQNSYSWDVLIESHVRVVEFNDANAIKNHSTGSIMIRQNDGIIEVKLLRKFFFRLLV